MNIFSIRSFNSFSKEQCFKREYNKYTSFQPGADESGLKNKPLDYLSEE